MKKSFRKESQIAQTQSLLHTNLAPSTSCSEGFQRAEQPIETIKSFLHNPDMWEEALLSLKEVGGGSSAWAHLFALRAKSK